MITWTPTVLSVLYACVSYFCILHLFSAIEHVSHGKALQKYAHYYYYYYWPLEHTCWRQFTVQRGDCKQS